jgi:hypothetical protein
MRKARQELGILDTPQAKSIAHASGLSRVILRPTIAASAIFSTEMRLKSNLSAKRAQRETSRRPTSNS